jgi:hypothetical protein
MTLCNCSPSFDFPYDSREKAAELGSNNSLLFLMFSIQTVDVNCRKMKEELLHNPLIGWFRT